MSICYKYETQSHMEEVQQLHHIYQAIYNPRKGEEEIILPHAIGKGKMNGSMFRNDIRMIDYQTRFNDGFQLTASCEVPHIDLIFCLGEALRWTVRGQHKQAEIKEGQSMIALNRGTGKACQVPYQTDMNMIEVKIPETVFGQYYGQSVIERLEEASNLVYKLTPKVHGLLLDIRGNTYEGAMGQIYGEAKLMELVTVQLADTLEKRDKPYSDLSMEDRKRIMMAKVIIDEQYASSPTIKELSRAIGINEYKLKRGFKELFAISIRQQVIQRKMEKAYELFQEGNVSVTHVANEVGYTNVSHFASAFRRIYGMNPSKYSCLG